MSSRPCSLWIVAFLAVAACLGVCGVAGIMLLSGDDLLRWIEQQNALQVGSPAPDFSLRTLEGTDLRLSQYRGRPVLLTFAVSWCPACREETPYQQALHVQHPEMALLLVDNAEQESVVRSFVDEFGMTFPVLLDTTGPYIGSTA